MSCLLDSVKESGWFGDIPENDIASPADIARSRSFQFVETLRKVSSKILTQNFHPKFYGINDCYLMLDCNLKSFAILKSVC